MSGPTLRDSQMAMARYLRNPAGASAPPGVEQRRLDIYERLVYNNIESFISKGFPVLRSLYQDDAWHRLVRAFIQEHRSQAAFIQVESHPELPSGKDDQLLRTHPGQPADPGHALAHRCYGSDLPQLEIGAAVLNGPIQGCEGFIENSIQLLFSHSDLSAPCREYGSASARDRPDTDPG